MSPGKEIPYGYCQCGCGQKTLINERTRPRNGYIKGEPRAFLWGHNSKHGGKKLEKNGRWRGGRNYTTGGYPRIKKHSHPRADKRGYVAEHILVVEKAMGKPLPPGAEIHHVNEDKACNFNKNLVVCQDVGYHRLLHKRQRALDACGHTDWRKCRYCGQWDDVKNLSIYGPYASHNVCANKHQAELRYKAKHIL